MLSNRCWSLLSLSFFSFVVNWAIHNRYKGSCGKRLWEIYHSDTVLMYLPANK